MWQHTILAKCQMLLRLLYTMLCLAGNKEAHWDGEPTPPQQPAAGTPYEKAQQHRRFQVYVHSKMMIVDDEVQEPLCAAVQRQHGILFHAPQWALGTLGLCAWPLEP